MTYISGTSGNSIYMNNDSTTSREVYVEQDINTLTDTLYRLTYPGVTFIDGGTLYNVPVNETIINYQDDQDSEEYKELLNKILDFYKWIGQEIIDLENDDEEIVRCAKAVMSEFRIIFTEIFGVTGKINNFMGGEYVKYNSVLCEFQPYINSVIYGGYKVDKFMEFG